MNVSLLQAIKLRRIFQQPILLNAGNVSDESLVSRLNDLVEDDPVCFPVLWMKSVTI